MESLSLYRKYRPQKLQEVIGQNHITKTLTNQIKTGSINHAYLFCGSRGVGKTSIARIFSRAINCQNPINGEPCENCEMCKNLSKENLDIIEIDAASNNRVDEIRELREKVKFPPINAKKKVYIIDEVHMLSDSAFNALLKTLEEPPAHVVFILATTEPQKLPATILSRCVRFDFKLISIKELENLLKKIFTEEKIIFDEDSLNLIADVANGSARDCLSVADMCASFCERNLTYEKVIEVIGAIDKNVLIDLNENILNKNIENVFKIYNKLSTNGKGVNVIIKEMLSFWRDITIIKTCKNSQEMVALPKGIFDRMLEFSKNVDNNRIIAMVDGFAKLEIDVKNSLNANLLFEALLIKQTINETENKSYKKEIPAVIKQLEKQAEKSFASIFGKLLTELKNQGFMALYGLLSEITNGKVENGFLIGFLTSDSGISLIEKEENKSLINTILSDVLREGLKFKVEIERKTLKDDFQNLNNMLGGKLIIE